MPPFEYRPFEDPYVGTISDLMGRGDEARANALLRIGEIQARAAQERGQAWSGAVQSLGNITSQAISQYASPEAQREREREKGKKILSVLGNKMIDGGMGQRVVRDGLETVIVPPDAGDPFLAPYRNISFGGGSRPSVTTESSFRLQEPSVDGQEIENNVQENDFLGRAIARQGLFGVDSAGSEIAPPDMRDRAMTGSFGTVTTRQAPDRLESYRADPRHRYTTPENTYDVKQAYADLVNGGISNEVALELVKQGQEANLIFSMADDLKEKYNKSQVAIRGSIANLILKAHDANPSSSLSDVARSLMGPAGNRIPPDQLEAFEVAFFGKEVAQQRQLLESMVEQWDAQGPRQEVSLGSSLVGVSGRPQRIGARPQTNAELESQQNRNDYQAAVKRGFTGSFLMWEAIQKRGPASLEQQLLEARANGDEEEFNRIIGVERSLAEARKQPLDPVIAAINLLTMQGAKERLEVLQRENNAARMLTQVRDSLPSGFNAAFGRATLGMPATRRENFYNTLADILARGDERELTSFLRQAALEGAPVEQRRTLEARMDGIKILEEVLADLQALKKSGVSTNVLTGTLESLANAVGATSIPRLAAIVTRIRENQIIYRQAISGAAFSKEESRDYEEIMPSFMNTFELNETRIKALLNSWGTREQNFWNRKLGEGWGTRIMTELRDLSAFDELEKQ